MQRVLSIAPMLDWTDRHFRYFVRLISRRVLLYTEMVTAGAILFGNRDHLLGFHPAEKPLALQLGGSNPSDLAECARIAEAYGYDEINLNVGCPSDRVQNGRFGACLMADPELVSECVAAMAGAVSLPITVKTRIGIDEQDSYEDLARFVEIVSSGGCHTFVIHARKAWLKGLSPKENREIPPLRYDVVDRIKDDYAALEIILNGGIVDLDQAGLHLERFDGVMIGRAAYHQPYLLAEADRRFFGDDRPVRSRRQVVEALLPYVETELGRGVRLQAIARHILGLYHGMPGGRAWRRHLSQHATKANAGADVLLEATRYCEESICV
ncbi:MULTISPECIES: tRNA dihydrouridine(20/20a) synthase DusA [Methylocaldum]|uniref:tRNA dihydrouridine(20/20a) synthase DusA n=1 Tax=unclassified Methylocaldum TaxID=2622260 RepID=UPI000989CD64|nr:MULTISPECIES: tRNA dihydrouridine(20/20a) synthase DusA [unclassified Methylocaldum]MVF20199.1 tRNA dihydrouridine(20/20a) synthase DusA [Methylocaldum sp. BRCS4]